MTAITTALDDGCREVRSRCGPYGAVRFAIAAVAAASALFGGDAGAQTPAPSSVPRVAPMTDPCLRPLGPVLTDATPSASASVGLPFFVALRGTPSAGYRWTLAPLGTASGFVTLTGTQSVSDVSFRAQQSAGGPPMVGGDATQLWMFTPRAPGTAVLTFTYRGPGAPQPNTVPPARVFTIRIGTGVATVC